MASTSPYTQNDYQATSSFRPYQLPINDIMKAYVAQNEFWDQGAERVKSVYDNALGLDLTLQGNRDLRDEYMRNAEKQITKLSSMDLSDPGVQRQGFSLFQPIFKDEGIMSDNAATKHIAKINSDALSYRDKDNGKEYSALNHQYALAGAKEFRNATDRMAGKAYLQQAKEYEPFYDPTQELTRIMKICKPDKGEKDSIQGFSIEHRSEESLTAAKITSCFDGGLSDKARRQIQINGAVTYNNQPQALRDKYIPHLQGELQNLANAKASAQAVISNAGNLKNLKPADLKILGFNDASEVTPQAIENLKATVNNADGRMLNLKTTINDLQAGNFGAISGDNFERVAGTVYSRDYMKNIGEGFAYKFETNKLTRDPLQMMIFRENQQNERQNQLFDHEDKRDQLRYENQMAMLKYKISITGKKGVFDINNENLNADRVLGSTLFNTVNAGKLYDDTVKEADNLAKQQTDAKSVLAHQLNTTIPTGLDLNSEEGKNWLTNFERTMGNDPTIKGIVDSYYDNVRPLQQHEQLLRGKIALVDQQVEPVYENIKQDKKALSNMGYFSAQMHSTPVSGYQKDVKQLILKRDLGDLAQDVITGKARVQKNGLAGGTTLFYVQDGVHYSTDFAPGSKESQVLGHVLDFQAKRQHDGTVINQVRNEAINSVLQQHEAYNITALNDNKGQFKLNIIQQIGLPQKYIDRMTVGATDANGHLLVTFAPATKSETDYTPGAYIKALLGGSGTTNVQTDHEGRPQSDGNSVMLSDVAPLKLINNNSLSNYMKPLVSTLKGLINQKTPIQSTAYLRAPSGNNYRVEVSQGYSGGYTYRIVSKDQPTKPILSSDNEDDVLQQFETLMGGKLNMVNIPKQ